MENLLVGSWEYVVGVAQAVQTAGGATLDTTVTVAKAVIGA